MKRMNMHEQVHGNRWTIYADTRRQWKLIQTHETTTDNVNNE